ncbi:MAG: hypothetical protein IJ751_08530 [Oscillospiraceae bacterium]|nr:hypothetical protein [Oscillospiraceae bacterium]
MFGYVLPYKEALTDEQWQAYHAAYCGLCHGLKERYGFLAQFLLNYDFTFLTMLLRREEGAPEQRCLRCVSAPVRGRNACVQESVNELAADCSMLLMYWKLRDQLADERGFRKLPALFLLILYRRAFRRAAQNAPACSRSIEENLRALGELERQNSPSIDRTADRFARILSDLTPSDWPLGQRRATEQLLYHLGRWIYLIDAWDDLKEDFRKRDYNPIISRFGLTREALEQAPGIEAREEMDRTLRHSENLAISAFHLGSFGYYAPIIENILCAGLPMVRQMVFSGQWKKRHRIKKQELNRQ